MSKLLNKIAEAFQHAASGKKPIMKESDREERRPADKRGDAELLMSQEDSHVCPACGAEKH